MNADSQYKKGYTKINQKRKQEGGRHIRLQDIVVGSPFWYRRLNEISLLISLLLLALFGVGAASGDNIDTALRVPLTVAILAFINTCIAILALFQHTKEEASLVWGAVNYGLLAITVGLLVYLTGGIFSPYIALWMLVAVFGGLFGTIGLLVLAFVINVFVVWQIANPVTGLTNERLAMFALAADLPLVVSYIIWHKKSLHENRKDKAVTALTKQLSEVANQSEIVINSIADGVIAIDSSGAIQLINPAAQTLVGWGEAEATGLHYESVITLFNKAGQPLSSGQNPFEEVKVTKHPIVNNDLTLISRAEKKMLVSLVVSPVLEGTEVVAVIVVFRDITAEKAREREQAEFISTASHEMRTPVAAIEGYLGLALNQQTAVIDDKARLYLGKAQEAVQHLGRLFQDLLTVSRAEDSRLEEHPVVTDIVAFMGNLTEGLMPKAMAKGIDMQFEPYAGRTEEGKQKLTPIFYANVDRDHLREVAANLVENAIKYTPEGKVTVNVTGDEKQITIGVTDSGIGIAREDLPHLFQKFYRVDNRDTREIGGTGLGLYISRRLAESMRGRIWVESEAGKGSTFFVSLPRISSLEIHHLQQSEAIEALQQTNAVAPLPSQPAASMQTSPTPSESFNNPAPVDVMVPQPPTNTDTAVDSTPLATEPNENVPATPMVEAPLPPEPIEPIPEVKPISVTQSVINDIQPSKDTRGNNTHRGVLAIPGRGKKLRI